VNFRSSWIYPLVATVTLGMAPYTPEPHIWKQLTALSRGTIHEFIDWFDLVLHGFPWVWFGVALFHAWRGDRNEKN
jgi:hypothetical protein